MNGNTAGDDEIRDALQAGLSARRGEQVRVAKLQRRRYEYWSSCLLEELHAEFDDGPPLTLLFKRFDPTSLAETTRLARHQSLFDPAREIVVYTRLLSQLDLGTATCYASVNDPAHERYWLFLEKVRGKELYKVAEMATWQAAATWLANFHRLASTQVDLDQLRLLQWNAERYGQCWERAEAFQLHSDGAGPVTPETVRLIRSAYTRWSAYVEQMPKTIIHGEFYASNVLVVGKSSGVRVCPIDWETAGWGCPLIDLAALIAGRWSEQQRRVMISAYWTSLDRDQQASWRSEQAFQTSLDGCRLHLAVQMLGRPAAWKPPAEHRYDWLSEARELSERLLLFLDNSL